jgi:hypothetical protein
MLRGLSLEVALLFGWLVRSSPFFELLAFRLAIVRGRHFHTQPDRPLMLVAWQQCRLSGRSQRHLEWRRFFHSGNSRFRCGFRFCQSQELKSSR